MKIAMLLIPFLFPLVALAESITTSEVTYSDGDTELKGFLAHPQEIKEKRPGILVVHEWWGHNEYARKRAKMLAELGYVALAVDMYGDGKQADHPSKAKEFSSHVASTHGLMEVRFGSALRFLKNQESVDSGRIGAIGYCFGGGTVLEMARKGLDLDGVVSFHGSLGTKQPAEQDVIIAEILVFNGADDPFVPEDQVTAFKEEMDQAGATYEFINYPGAKHSFTNPKADEFGKKFELPLEYNEKADKDSWEKMKAFFQKVFD